MVAASPSVADATARPRRVSDGSAWVAADFPRPESYRRCLDRDMIGELEAAALAHLASGAPLLDVDPALPTLPKTRRLLDAAYDDVELARGFTVIAGLPVDDWGIDVSRAALCLVGRRFGAISLQNREGEFIVDVMDRATPLSSQARGYHSNDKLDFHNDGANVVALLCMETAKAGGESLLVSASTLYNVLARERSDVMATLMRGYRHSRRNQREANQAPVMEDPTPVFSFIDGVFHNCYSRISIVASLDQGLAHSEQERAALDAIDAVLARPELVLAMEFRKGDIQLVNNFTILHSRKAFIDHSAERRRHLLRLWLTDPASKYNGPGKMDFYMPHHSRFLKTRGYGIFAAR